jgi:ribonucleoside-diphosphate reductase alpha chain
MRRRPKHKEEAMTKLKQLISDLIWDTKYRYRWGGKIIDQNISDTWKRIAKAVAKAEKTPELRRHWQTEFYRILENFHFLPGGRIQAGSGTKHKVTLFNCFVMDIKKDSLTEIFDALKEGALTLQQGGGVGYDFSILRPAGDTVRKTGSAASGPISFMNIWDSMCAVLLSTGARRGAMMGVLRCDHPDIEAFVEAKRDPHALRHFNVSVMVSDAFMQAVKDDAKWPLIFPVTGKAREGEIIERQWGDALTPVPCRVYRYIRARALWEKIIRSAYDYAEPGVLFSDTINRTNNLWYRERINATNPCAEIPLPAYGACNLGSINLTQFVIAPFTPQAKLNWQGIEETTRIATRFLDNVIDVSHFPLKAQRMAAKGSRRIGLGLTGLGDALVMLGLRYGSKEAQHFARDIMRTISDATWLTSIALAEEKGAFPFYSQDYLQGEFIQQLNPTIRNALAEHGVRNSHHNTIAPTGTISLLANNVSNGIEPIFKAEYDRHVRGATQDEIQTYRVADYAYQLWREHHADKSLPPAWVDASALTPEDHLYMQSAVQPYIDNAISKTINLPANFPFEKVADVYTLAHSLGLKGCTIFRPNPITGSVLEEDSCCPAAR